jgi:hypothetical protein
MADTKQFFGMLAAVGEDAAAWRARIGTVEDGKEVTARTLQDGARSLIKAKLLTMTMQEAFDACLEHGTPCGASQTADSDLCTKP